MHKDIQAVRNGVDIGAALRLLHDAGVIFADILPLFGTTYVALPEKERAALNESFAKLSQFDSLGDAGECDCWTDEDAEIWTVLRETLKDRTSVFAHGTLR